MSLLFRKSIIRCAAVRRSIRLFPLGLLFLAAPCFVQADEFMLTPSLVVRESYNDNILFETQDALRDFITVAVPALALRNRSETTDLNLRAELAANYYSRYTTYNAVDTNLLGSVMHRFTPGLNMSGSLGYIKDSSPDRDVETTGLVFDNITRERFRGSLSSEYLPSEKTTLGISYNFGRERYDSNYYVDLDSQGVQLSGVHDLDAWFSRTKGRMNLGYDNYRYDRGAVINNGWATVGVSRNLTETTSFLLDAGGRYTVTDFDLYRNDASTPLAPVLVKQEETTRGWGWVMQGTVAYKGEKGSANLSLGNNFFPASGQTQSTERLSLGADMRYRLTYEWSVAVNGAYYRNKSVRNEFSILETDEHTLWFSPSMRYEFTKDLYLDVYYSFTRVDYRQSDTEATRNLVMVKLTWQFPWEK